MKEQRDNLKNYRNTKSEINKELIQKSINSILEVDGVLSYNNVSKTSYLISDITLGEKGVSSSAISKNSIYKSMIDEAKYKKRSSADLEKNSNSKIRGSLGDLKMQIFNDRVEKERLNRENLILKELLRKYGGNLNFKEINNLEKKDNCKYILQASKGLINRLFELELAEYKLDTGELLLAELGDVLLNKKAYDLIMMKDNHV